MKKSELELYLSNGVEQIVKGIMKVSLKNPRMKFFMAQYSRESGKAVKRRSQYEGEGLHIPPFLIASITTECNLHCKGCYARANHSCCDSQTGQKMLDRSQWGDIFSQAAELGVGFILLAGGEPFVRKDVLEEAGRQRRILFPVFTNGTLIDEEYIQFLLKNPNVIPVLSMEGGEKVTDGRRGTGTWRMLVHTMEQLLDKEIIYGVSVTVTKENAEEVFSDGFTKKLAMSGCKAVVYVEYVPVVPSDRDLAPDEKTRAFMDRRLAVLRETRQELLFVAFPGDERKSGGCLAAGRGFFHINPWGGAEPCPFSPYSDTSLVNTSLCDALQSPFFRRLNSQGNLEKEHIGGCVLFEQEKKVKELLGG